MLTRGIIRTSISASRSTSSHRAKDGNCLSAQIERNARLLADPQVPRREKLIALAFLVHFVGDLHQPMHAGDHGDLGGNKVAVSYGLIAGHTNLHGIWDGWLAERALTTPPSGAAALLAEVLPAERAAIAAGSVEDWSREIGPRRATSPTRRSSPTRADRPWPSARC